MHDVIDIKQARQRLQKKRNTYNTVYQFKVQLKHISIPIWRRFLISANATFHDLHNALQVIMGWEGGHSYRFYIKNPRTEEEFNVGHEHEPDMHNEYTEHIQDYISIKTQYIYYTYNIQKNWFHEIIFETILPRNNCLQYPLCIKGQNSAPPEICKGPDEYNRFLEIYKTPSHAEHSKSKSQFGDNFDPFSFTNNAYCPEESCK